MAFQKLSKKIKYYEMLFDFHLLYGEMGEACRTYEKLFMRSKAAEAISESRSVRFNNGTHLKEEQYR